MDKYLVSPNPHIHAAASTNSLMRDVLIALAPATLASILFYGWHELLIIAVAVISCVLLEHGIARFLMKKPQIANCPSATVTGLLLALTLPSTTPWWIVLIGCIIAIGVAKMTFGGLGQNVFNPALTGRVFLLISFPQQMTNWTAAPGFVHFPDAISGATPLGVFSEGGMQKLLEMGYSSSNELFFDIGGSAGEISAIALLLGFAYMVIRKVIKPWIPLSIIGTVGLMAGIFYLIDPATYTGAIFNILTGGLLLGSIFMATDYVTSPMSTWGGVVYGVGIGVLTMLIRYFGSYPEGISFAILIMNMTVPLLNKWFHQKKYGRA